MDEHFKTRLKDYKLRMLLIICSLMMQRSLAELNAFRVEDPPTSVLSVSAEGVIHVKADQKTVLRLFSSQPFSSDTQISFTTTHAAGGTNCDDLRITEIRNVHYVSANTALVTVEFHAFAESGSFMFCVRTTSDSSNKSSPWIHQGNSSWLQIVPIADPNVEHLIPTWAKIVLIILFLCLSGVFSGLALVLLSLTRSELKVLRNQGTSKERRYIKSLIPLRKRGNYLLCTILLINTFSNILVTVLLYQLIGLYSLLAATFLIVFLGEILPQVICSWFGLAIGAKTVWFTNFFLILTFLISYPVGKLMDLLLDDEIPAIYNRDRLLGLVKPANTENEVKLGKAVTPLDLSTKCVRDIMTKLEDVYMVEFNSVLTSDMLNQILKMGFTRVPVYEKERSNIVALLHVKDLALLDPDGTTSLKTLCKFFNHPVNFVFEDTKLNVMLEEFKKGQSHMAFVQRVNSEGMGDPFYETLGMVTLEDVIEDIFQSEISDESTVVLDNKEMAANLRKLNVNRLPVIQRGRNDAVSNNTLQAARNFLSSFVEQFKPQWITERVLEHLIEQSQVTSLQLSDPASKRCIYEMGKVSDHFVFVLNGSVQVDIGNEHFTFVEGPFSYFGSKVLTDAIEILTNSVNLGTVSEKVSLQQSRYIPDFTLRAITEVQYLSITKALYVAALRASLLQRQQGLNAENVDLRLPDYNSLSFVDIRTNPLPNDGFFDPRLIDFDARWGTEEKTTAANA